MGVQVSTVLKTILWQDFSLQSNWNWLITDNKKSQLHNQETQEDNFLGETNSFQGQFLHPSPVQISSSIQLMQTVQMPKQVSYFLPVFL